MTRVLSPSILLPLIMMYLSVFQPPNVDAAEPTSATVTEKAWPDPARYEKVISGFEANTTAPKQAIVAYGSSSIGGWHKAIREDLAPITVVPRGFGGSNMNDALHFMDRVILPLQPVAVLLYEGDNDVHIGQSNDAIFDKYQEFITRLHTALPQTHTHIISVKPSIARWEKWPTMRELNERLKKLAANDPLVTYIDVASPMLNAEGTPREDIFLTDKLHMNRKGYDIWKEAVRPILIEAQR